MIPVLVAALAASAVLLLSYGYGTSAAVNATSHSNVNATLYSPQIDLDELQLLRDRRPDYSGPAELALSISWPLYEDGKKASPMSYTGIRGEDGGISAVLPSYAEARQRAASRQEWSGKKSGILPEDRVFGSCSNFISTVVINTVTPAFPKFTGEIYDWVTNPDNGWQLVGTSETYDPSSYRPGDVFLTRGEGHTFLRIGEYEGYPDVIAEASNSSDEKTRTGALLRCRIDPQTGGDSSGRLYDVWRYVG